jgi:hypothetical protein
MSEQEREHIDHNRPLVYVFENHTTGDVIVENDHAESLRRLQRADPKHKCSITARNVRLP